MKTLKLLFLVLLITSCGSRKKALEKTSEQTKTENAREVDSVVQNDKQKDIKEDSKERQSTTDEDIKLEADIADPTKPASAKKIRNDSVTEWQFNNLKNVKLGDSKKTSDSSKETIYGLSERDKSAINYQLQEFNKEQIDKQEKTLEVESDKGTPWSAMAWAAIGIAALIIIGLMIYFNRIRP
ncbi:hypothetical protein AAU57_11915 [Nonlabens sp. YIK11]|uniref:hypothetical protein n=1 Tax=Nonlabens sp. YIK11 TaxID=1453349 RepID=UPI0006DBFFAC|nr:hypothetical protein [Nonlabens sp. YIK11]KQC33954.1 hypothetical protein AAU57_11915 [Nonlabens sp. YIK11]